MSSTSNTPAKNTTTSATHITTTTTTTTTSTPTTTTTKTTSTTNYTSTNPTPYANLMPPKMVDADDDGQGNGGLGYYDLLHNPRKILETRVGPYLDVADGDDIQLFLDDTMIYSRFVKKDETGVIVLEPTAEHFINTKEGLHGLWYKFISFPGGIEFPSDETALLIKTTIPGDPDKDLPFPEENYKLEKASIVPEWLAGDTEKVTITVPKWTYQSGYDTLTIHWSGFEHSIRIDDIDNDTVIVLDDLQSKIPGGRTSLRYSITDDAGNYSLLAPSTTVDVDFDYPEQPAAPRLLVDGHEDEEIDMRYLLTADLAVVVPANENLQPGQAVVVEAYGRNADGEDMPFTSEPQNVGSPVEDMLFKIPNGFVKALVKGSIRVAYHVDGQHLSKSTFRPVTHTVIAAPKLPQAKDDKLDYLRDVQPDQHLKVDVEPYPGMRAGQKVTVVWKATGVVEWRSEEKTVRSPETLNFLLPDSLAMGGYSSEVSVTSFVNGIASTPRRVTVEPQAVETPAIKITSGGDKYTADIEFPDWEDSDRVNLIINGRVAKRSTSYQRFDEPERATILALDTWIAENRGGPVLFNYSIWRTKDGTYLFSRPGLIQL